MTKAITEEQLNQILAEAYAHNAGYEDGKNLDMETEFERLMQKAIARLKGKQDGKEYKLSNPNEPRFEDDFDVDTEPYEPAWRPLTLQDIAITKAHAYAQEYNTQTGRVEDKHNYHALKEGYMAGFLEGFAHRLTRPTGE